MLGWCPWLIQPAQARDKASKETLQRLRAVKTVGSSDFAQRSRANAAATELWALREFAWLKRRLAQAYRSRRSS